MELATGGLATEIDEAAELTKSGAVALALRECVEFFKGRNVTEVIDIGCGRGDGAVFLAREGFVVQGFDPSDAAVRDAQARTMRENLVAEFACAPVEAFPFEGEIFDAAISVLGLAAATPRQTAMAIDQMAHRVRRGGVAFVLFPPYAGERSLKDNDLRRIFLGFRLLDFRSYPGGLRGLFLKRESGQG